MKPDMRFVRLTSALLLAGVLLSLAGLGYAQAATPAAVPAPFQISDFADSEGDSGSKYFDFVVTRLNPSITQVEWTTATSQANAALESIDYQPARGILYFDVGVITQTIRIQVYGDTETERDETFLVRLINEDKYMGVVMDEAVGTILNDDMFASTGPISIPIPDIACIESPLFMGVNGIVSDVRVEIEMLTHPNLFDLTMTLNSPDGKSVMLLQEQTSDGENMIGTIFDDSAASPIDYGTPAPYTGRFKPFNSLRAFRGSQIGGTWILKVCDLYYADMGILQGWNLDFTRVANQFNIVDISNNEGNSGQTPFVFTINRAYPSDSSSVSWSTADESATGSTGATGDYVIASGWVNFAPGETSKTITVNVNGDTDFERYETFQVNLSNPVNGVLGDAQAIGTIRNDEANYLTINDVSKSEGASGTTLFIFTVTHQGTGYAGTVEWSTSPGFGIGGADADDFVEASGILTFNPGVSSLPIEIAVNGDTQAEGNETFTVNLSNPVNMEIIDGTGVGTILNDEYNVISIGDVTQNERNSGSFNFNFPVTRSAPNGTSTVNWVTTSGSAVSPGDFTDGSGTLTFPATGPYSRTLTVSIPVIGDFDIESNEKFTVTLSAPVNGMLLDDKAVGVILNDELVYESGLLNEYIAPGQCIENAIPVSKPGLVDSARVEIISLTHPDIFNYDINLLSPDGKTVVLSQGWGAGGFVKGTEFNHTIFDDLAALTIYQGTPPYTGAYRPDSTLSALLGSPTRGQWKLSVCLDDGASFSGALKGWKLSLNPLTNGISIGDVSQPEGSSGTTSFAFTIRRGSASGISEVSWSTADSSANSSDYQPANGTVTFNEGDTEKTVYVDVYGDDEFEPDELFYVNLSNPNNAVILDEQGQGVIQKDEISQFSIAPVTRQEGNSGETNLVFTVTHTGTEYAATVNWKTEDGDGKFYSMAVAGTDYLSGNGILDFPVGQAMRTITVTVKGDTQIEPDESFGVVLYSPVMADLAQPYAPGVILNDDFNGLSIGDVTLAEGNSGMKTFSFVVTRTPASGISQVSWATAEGGSASYRAAKASAPGVADGDFMPASGVVEFANGETSKNIDITVLGDQNVEWDEAFSVNLNSPVSATLVDSQGLGIIQTDDGVYDSGPISMHVPDADCRESIIPVPTLAERVGDVKLEIVSFTMIDSYSFDQFTLFAPDGKGEIFWFPSGNLTNVVLSSYGSLNGSPFSGEWKLRVCDTDNDGFTGTLYGWKLYLLPMDDFIGSQDISHPEGKPGITTDSINNSNGELFETSRVNSAISSGSAAAAVSDDITAAAAPGFVMLGALLLTAVIAALLVQGASSPLMPWVSTLVALSMLLAPLQSSFTPPARIKSAIQSKAEPRLTLAQTSTSIKDAAPNTAVKQPLATAIDDGLPFTNIWLDGYSDGIFAMEWGDMDGDGDLDLAAGTGNDVVRLYKNLGNNKFEYIPVDIPYRGSDNSNANSIAWADVDNDGDLDLAVSGESHLVTIYLNQGDGQFELHTDAFPAPESSLSMSFGDMDGDGDLDLVLPDGQNQLYRNLGGGHFAPVDGVSFDIIGYTAAWGDMDGDGDLDLAFDGEVVLYRNLGNGQFEYAPSPITEYFNRAQLLPAAANDLAWGDVDGDGDLDLVTGNEMSSYSYDVGQGGIYVFLNQGGGLFDQPPQVFGTPYDIIRDIDLGDLNGDGDLDIFASNTANNLNVLNRIILNQGNGVFEEVPFALDGALGKNECAAMADMDNDGDLDLAICDSNKVPQLFRNDSPVSLSDAPTSLPSNFYQFDDAVLGNLDAGSSTDIIGLDIINPGPFNPLTRVYTIRNLGGWRFEQVSSFDAAQRFDQLVDIDGDGDLDLTGAYMMLNDGAGNLTKIDGSPSTLGGAWADIDGDGDLDVLVGGATLPTYLYLNDGAGNFTQVTSPFAPGAMAMAWGDYDNDGDIDLVIGYQRLARLFKNLGGVQFEEVPLAFFTGNPTIDDIPAALAWADLNGDGLLDLVAANTGDHFTGQTGTVWDGQVNRLFINRGNDTFEFISDAFGVYVEATTQLAVIDFDLDGDMDVVFGGNNQPYRLFLNQGDAAFVEVKNVILPEVATSQFENGHMHWTDLDGDGDLDVIITNIGVSPATRLLVNKTQELRANQANNSPVMVVLGPYGVGQAAGAATAKFMDENIIPVPFTLFDPEAESAGEIKVEYSPNGGGQWFPAAAASGSELTNLAAGGWINKSSSQGKILPIWEDWGPGAVTPEDGINLTSILSVTNDLPVGDIEIWLDLQHLNYEELGGYLQAPNGTQVELFNPGDLHGSGTSHLRFSTRAAASIASDSFPYTKVYRPVGDISTLLDIGTQGNWILVIEDTLNNDETGLVRQWGFHIQTRPAEQTFLWDTFASGFFGQSDNVVLRFTLLPYTARGTSGEASYINSAPGEFHRGLVRTQTLPFRARGTQVRVMSGGQPAPGALVYRLPAGSVSAGSAIGAGQPFLTNELGYLAGRGVINPGDQLMALLPITATESYTLYHTSAVPIESGLDAFAVSSAGVQTLTVSAANPLILFNIDVSLEWDASKDTLYLDQLTANLQRASEYLYDFTNGQVALGKIRVHQNRDYWDTAHVTIMASNRLRPWSAEGGIVITNTVAPFTDTLTYSPGQLTIGAVWNRYGTPGVSMGEDWPIILAHELSHYLLFLDDVYLGIDPASGQLIPVDTCKGSAMGDLYSDPANTEFIYNKTEWETNCAATLANQMTGMPEWDVLTAWYNAMQKPATLNPGPSSMPFEFTSIEVNDPYTTTAVLVDPTFYIAYQNDVLASTAARAYLEKPGVRLVNLGAPSGGQNRVIARGAEVGDRLCVFDPVYGQFGCETITTGDDVLTLRQDAAWMPVVALTPITTETLALSVTLPVEINEDIYVRLFPDYDYPYDPVRLEFDGNAYTAILQLGAATLSGSIQIYVDETNQPRREAILPFSVGGNPGYYRAAGGGGYYRAAGGGGYYRAAGGGGYYRAAGGGGLARGGNAPILSPDGNLIFFTRSEITFTVGTLFTIQAMAGLPDLPPGHTLIGQAYNIIASPGARLPEGSVSIQYLQNDVNQAGAQERDLQLYYYDGSRWSALTTVRDEYYNLVSAPSQGAGIYALLSSVKILLYGPGWNIFSYPLRESQAVTMALESIAGSYSTVYAYDPSSSTRPWTLYDVTVPSPFDQIVNTLKELTFGHGYWIYATKTITAYLGGPGINTPTNLPLPPATFYGFLLPTKDMQPQAGMAIQAYIGDKLCGQTTSQLIGEQVVYSIQVASEVETPGCGSDGRNILFKIPGQSTTWQIAWHNDHAYRLDLGPMWRIFLPLLIH